MQSVAVVLLVQLALLVELEDVLCEFVCEAVFEAELLGELLGELSGFLPWSLGSTSLPPSEPLVPSDPQSHFRMAGHFKPLLPPGGRIGSGMSSPPGGEISPGGPGGGGNRTTPLGPT